MQKREEVKHVKNQSDNSIMYTSHSCGKNIKELIDTKVGRVGMQMSYSPYVSNSNGGRKGSQRSKSTGPGVNGTKTSKMNSSEGFVNIDLSQLPHDMTQREVVETMIRKHEISNFMYEDEEGDTTRYIMQNLDDRRTCRRSQCNKKDEEDPIKQKDSISPVDFQKKIILASKRDSTVPNIASIETEEADSNRLKDSIKLNLITDEVVSNLLTSMTENIKYLSECNKNKPKSTTAQDERKFFIYWNTLEDLSAHYPKLKPVLSTLKEGFQQTIRNIVASEVKEKGLRENSRLLKERENITKIQKQLDDKYIIITEQEDLIGEKDNTIKSLRKENEILQGILEKHRVSGMALQEENEVLRREIERMRKVEEEMIERWEMFESTDQDLAIALKEMREQEQQQYEVKFKKYAKNIPKIDMEQVQEIIRLKCEDSGVDSYEEEGEESSRYDHENSDRLSYDDNNKAFDDRRYYSERNAYEEYTSSEDEPIDAKQNIRALLQASNNKPKLKADKIEDKPSLFDYQEKQSKTEDSKGLLPHENTIDQWEFEQNPESEHNDEESSWLGSDKYMLYDDSSSSAWSYRSGALYETNPNPCFVPKLNLGGFKAPPAQPKTNPVPEKPKELKGLALGNKLEALKKKDFQDEFMENYNEFSESWREQIEREKRF